MGKEKKCFVIIGYGKKTSYAKGKPRVLDLDETFALLIKPVFDSLNIPCYRAIDKNLTENIDKLMLREIKNADIALADISTLNANVMWELGVRHALKPRYTIMICEKEQMNGIPFDINHFPVHQYTHTEEGIPYKEVERFKNNLFDVVKGILNQNPEKTDSPVYTFLEDELNSKTQVFAKKNTDNTIPFDSFATIMEKAEKAKDNKQFDVALELYNKANEIALKNMTLKSDLSFIICRQALCTYKSKKPNDLDALKKAKYLLESLNPVQSQDIEVLGISGAVHKRLNEITGDEQYLDNAIQFYERGFQLKQDYYNGINTAFMLYQKVSLLKARNMEWEDIKIKADYIRNSVLKIATELESDSNFNESKETIWVLLTIAEAYNYKKDKARMEEYEEKARKLANIRDNTFSISSYEEQKQKIAKLEI